MRTLKDIEIYYMCGLDAEHIELKELRQAAREHIKQIEAEMEACEEIEREQYLFLAGKRHMFIEFFNINGDK